jgi:hypothetical protein
MASQPYTAPARRMSLRAIGNAISRAWTRP